MIVETTHLKFRQDPVPFVSFVRSGDVAPAGGMCLPTKMQPRPACESTQPARYHGDLDGDFIHRWYPKSRLKVRQLTEDGQNMAKLCFWEPWEGLMPIVS